MPAFEGLGKALRWLRARQDKRQYQVAEAAGVTKAMLSAYETGKQKPSLETLEKILDGLGVSLGDLHHALLIVNGRADQLRYSEGSVGGEPRPLPHRTGEIDLYRVLGIQEALPLEEEQALRQMLMGFLGFLRFMHDSLIRQSRSPRLGVAAGADKRPDPERDSD
jgi:transcriptional regulator with XRE-family HTH domain